MILPTYVIDLHTHLFNARYLPLDGIMRRMGLAAAISYPLATVLAHITGREEFEDAADSESIPELAAANDLAGIRDRVRQAALAELAQRQQAAIDLAPAGADAASLARQSFEEDELAAALEQLALQYRLAEAETPPPLDLVSDRPAGAPPPTGEPERLLGVDLLSLFGDAIDWAMRKLEELTEHTADAFLHGENAIKFFGVMLCSEQTVLRRLRDSYADGPVGVRHMLHLMMDMEPSYGGKAPYYGYGTRQLKRMRELVQSSDGEALGFAAFHPYREHALKMAIRGLEAGNIGIKFYPPMGYRASDNDDPVVQRRVDELFAYCSHPGRDIPILTHCTPVGFEADKGWGLNSNPDFWATALEQFPNLRLSFGHAGGGYFKIDYPEAQAGKYYGWSAETEEQWRDPHNYASKVVRLCQEYPNVYCELAYLTDILHPEHGHERGSGEQHQEWLAQNLIRAFQSEDGDYPFAGKVAYGSDWHMMDMVDASALYLEKMVEVFQADALKNHIEAFFHGNAERFLKWSPQ